MDSEFTEEERFDFLNVLQFEQIKFDNVTSDDSLEVIYNVVLIKDIRELHTLRVHLRFLIMMIV